jgi:Protein of unknown function (DUF4065)
VAIHSTTRIPDDGKFKELVVFISQRCEGDPAFGATKLNKLLFYADFIAFLKTGKAITWHKYRRLENGPVPRRLVPIIRELETDGTIITVTRDHFGFQQKRTVARRDANLAAFSGEEIALVTKLIEEFWGQSAQSVSNESHEFIGWKIAEDGEDIPYEMALVRLEKPTPADMAVAEGLSLELQALAAEVISGEHS